MTVCQLTEEVCKCQEFDLEVLCPTWQADCCGLISWLAWKGRKPLPSLHCAVQERMDCGQSTAVSWWMKEEWVHGWVDGKSVVLLVSEIFSGGLCLLLH